MYRDQAVFQGILETFKAWAKIIDNKADDVFMSLTEDFLDDWDESWRLSADSVDDYVLNRVLNSSVFSVAEGEMKAGRWLGDHYKSRTWNKQWTEREWGYFLYMALRGKLNKNKKLSWGKSHHQQMQEVVNRVDKVDALGIKNPTAAMKKSGNALIRLLSL